jgi:plastocyanin
LEKMMKFEAAIPRKLGLLLSALLLVVASFALSASPAAAETFPVKMGSDTGELKFVPDTITIKPGDTVEWQMNKVPPHNVVFEESKIPNADKALAKKLSHEKLAFAPGETFKTTFSSDIPAGVYPYYCQPHRGAGMAGKVIVED